MGKYEYKIDKDKILEIITKPSSHGYQMNRKQISLEVNHGENDKWLQNLLTREGSMSEKQKDAFNKLFKVKTEDWLAQEDFEWTVRKLEPHESDVIMNEKLIIWDMAVALFAIVDYLGLDEAKAKMKYLNKFLNEKE